MEPQEYIDKCGKNVHIVRSDKGTKFVLFTEYINGMNTILTDEPDALKKRIAELEALQAEYEATKQKLRENETELEAIFNVLSVGVAVIESSHKSKRVNPETVRILKTPVEDILAGKIDHLRYCYSDGTPMPFDEIPGVRALKENRRIDNSEAGLIRADGSIIWTKISAVPLPGNGVVLACTDITETRRREEEYRLVVENASESIFIIDSFGVIEFMNVSAKKLLDGDYTGRPVTESVLREFAVRLSEMTRAVIETETPQVEEIKAYRDNTPIWFYANCQPIKNDQDSGVSALVICTDITDLKKTEEMLFSTRQELEQKARILEETNIALKVLLRHQNDEKNLIYRNIRSAFNILVLPYLERLKQQVGSDIERTYIDIIEHNFEDIVSTLPARTAGAFSLLTPSEMQVANLIREGKSTKEITSILNISENTVSTHRKKIRTKLGIRYKKKSLITYLRQEGDTVSPQRS